MRRTWYGSDFRESKNYDKEKTPLQKLNNTNFGALSEDQINRILAICEED